MAKINLDSVYAKQRSLYMKITNNYQPNYNFKSGMIDAEGLKILRSRLPKEQCQKFVDRFKSRHEGSDYKILLGKGVRFKHGLDAMIEYGKNHFRYLEEGVLSSLLNPKVFMNKINRQIDKDVVSIGLKGHIS